MKIIFAFRTRLPFRSSPPSRFRSGFASLPEKLSYLLCSCQSSSLITVSRLQPLRSATLFFAWGTFRFRRFFRSVRFSPSRFLSVPPSFNGKTLVGSNGLGPSTSRLSGVCSNQLSYEPILVEVIGFEPMTPCLQGRCSTI